MLVSDIFCYLKDLSLSCVLLLYITLIRIYIFFGKFYFIFIFIYFCCFWGYLHFTILWSNDMIYLQLIWVIKKYVPRFFKNQHYINIKTVPKAKLNAWHCLCQFKSPGTIETFLELISWFMKICNNFIIYDPIDLEFCRYILIVSRNVVRLW